MEKVICQSKGSEFFLQRFPAEADINSRHSSHIVNSIKTKGSTARSKGSCWEGVMKRGLEERSRERYYYTLEKDCLKCVRREEKRINSVKKKSHQHCEGRFDEPIQNWRKRRSKFVREMILQTESSQKVQNICQWCIWWGQRIKYITQTK